MPTLSTEARNAAVDAVTALLDAGDIRFETAADNEVATLAFGNPAFGAAAAGSATANAITDDTDAAGGTIDHAKLRKSDASEVMTATVTATGGGGDFEMTSLTIGAGDTVIITSLTISQPAS